MKKKLITLFIIIFHLPFYSNDYVPMLGKSNEWYLVEFFEGYTTEIYETFEDVEINNKKYIPVGNEFWSPQIIYYLREDTAERKVYLIYGADTAQNEYVFYDFSKNEGDTFQIALFPYYDPRIGTIVIDSIRNVKTKIDTRRKFYVSGTTPYGEGIYPLSDIWIEGIGSISNFFEPGFFADWYTLSCFFKDDEHVYQSEQFDECNVLIFNIDKQPGIITELYPNPFSRHLTIDLNEMRNNLVSIINLSGQLVYRQVFHNSANAVIDLSQLEDGIYIMTVNNGYGVERKRIVKQGR